MTENKKVFELKITGTKIIHEEISVLLDRRPEQNVSGIEVAVEMGIPDHSVNQDELDRIAELVRELAGILINAVQEFEAME